MKVLDAFDEVDIHWGVARGGEIPHVGVSYVLKTREGDHVGVGVSTTHIDSEQLQRDTSIKVRNIAFYLVYPRVIRIPSRRARCWFRRSRPCTCNGTQIPLHPGPALCICQYF
jgi:hypothetical protein